MMYPVDLLWDLGVLCRTAGGSCAFIGQDDIVDMPHPSADYHEGCVMRVIPNPWLTSWQGGTFRQLRRNEILLDLVLIILRLSYLSDLSLIIRQSKKNIQQYAFDTTICCGDNLAVTVISSQGVDYCSVGYAKLEVIVPYKGPTRTLSRYCKVAIRI